MKSVIFIFTILFIKCRSQPAAEMRQCPALDCPPIINCRNGFAVDGRGCLTCQCQFTIFGCAEMWCPVGSVCKEVVSGCGNFPPNQLCDPVVNLECVSTFCPQLRCRECASGNVIDNRGCRTCACINPCESVNCPAGHICVNSNAPARFKCESIKHGGHLRTLGLSHVGKIGHHKNLLGSHKFSGGGIFGHHVGHIGSQKHFGGGAHHSGWHNGVSHVGGHGHKQPFWGGNIGGGNHHSGWHGGVSQQGANVQNNQFGGGDILEGNNQESSELQIPEPGTYLDE